MPKVLFVGDVHAKANELGDCYRLVEFIYDICHQHDANRVVFLGDQYHNHAVVHVEVMEFWREALRMLSKWRPILLRGNHDAPGQEGASAHALMAHEDEYDVVNELKTFPDLRGLAFIPYMTPEKFAEACDSYRGFTTLVCHQTFNGSTYENGFYAKDGVDPAIVPVGRIISGHIHMPQEFDKVWYPGSPRWQTVSDANTERAIHLCTFDMDGNLVERQAFSTGRVCRQILHYQLTPENKETLPSIYDDCGKHTVVVDVRGPADFIESVKPGLAYHGARVRTFKTDVKVGAIRESEGIGTAFKKYLDSFVAPKGTSKETLERLYMERING